MVGTGAVCRGRQLARRLGYRPPADSAYCNHEGATLEKPEALKSALDEEAGPARSSNTLSHVLAVRPPLDDPGLERRRGPCGNAADEPGMGSSLWRTLIEQ